MVAVSRWASLSCFRGPRLYFGRSGASLCLPAGGAVSLSGALWGRGWYPHMGGVLKGAQIGLGGLSCAGGACACAYVRVRAWVGE